MTASNLTTLNIAAGIFMLLLGAASLIHGVRTTRRGGLAFGKKGVGMFVLLGFAFIAMGSLLFLLGVLRAVM